MSPPPRSGRDRRTYRTASSPGHQWPLAPPPPDRPPPPENPPPPPPPPDQPLPPPPLPKLEMMSNNSHANVGCVIANITTTMPPITSTMIQNQLRPPTPRTGAWAGNGATFAL